MNVLVNGIGNLGTTLLNLLVDYKDHLGISNIYGLKKGKIQPWNEVEIHILQERGIQICSLDGEHFPSITKFLPIIHYVFDTNANGIGIQQKAWYDEFPNLIGASAQGSEKRFGVSHMLGINDSQISQERFAHIVSCNTHSLTALLNWISNGNWSDVVTGDFVVVRRSEDLGNHERLVSANVISRHLSAEFGTHHAIDVNDLLQTISVSIPLQSSDITTPSQLMHGVRFSIQLKSNISSSKLIDCLTESTVLATTNKYDSNVIFDLGRRYSRYGRMYAQAIVNANNLLVDEHTNTVKGWAFIPQEGNTILSTINAFVWRTQPVQATAIMKKLQLELIRKNW